MSELQPANPTDGRSDSSLRESQLMLLHAADQLILDKKPLSETLQFIVSETQRILGALHVDILFEYADGLRIEISSDQRQIARFVPIKNSIAGQVLSSRRPVLVNDIESDPLLLERFFPHVKMDSADQVPRRSVLVADLSLDGQTIGVINVEASPADRFGDSHLDFVNAAARLISVAISHAALFDEDNFRAATDRLLLEASSGDSEIVMRQVLEHILIALSSLTFLKPDAAEILFADPQDSASLTVVYSTNSANIGIRVDVDSSVCGQAFRHGQTVVVQRVFERRDYRPIVEGMRCEMAIPIIFGGSSRFPIGVLNLESSRENAFSNVGHVLAERFVRQALNAIAMTKIRTDMDNELKDQLMVLAADQVLNAVHRLNNHVGSIRAMALDLLEDLGSSSAVDPSVIRRLLMIENDANRALEIPDQLRKRIVAPDESVDVNAQVQAGLAAVRIPKHIELVIDLALGLPSIPCTALDLVIENLVLNAVKAMPRVGTLRVATWLDKRRPREPFIVITVQDTGVGMTQDEIDHLFEPRQTRRRGGGLGFGMMWVRGWVRRAQGLIDIESLPGSGTTVNIRFQIDPSLIEHVREVEPT
jgi:signal transduction histidine kinase